MHTCILEHLRLNDDFTLNRTMHMRKANTGNIDARFATVALVHIHVLIEGGLFRSRLLDLLGRRDLLARSIHGHGAKLLDQAAKKGLGEPVRELIGVSEIGCWYV